MKRLRPYALFVVLAIALVALLVADLLLGTTEIPLADVWATLTGGVPSDATNSFIIRELRLPKVIVAIFAGMALSASGLQMQTLFRNPLAGPYVPRAWVPRA